MKMLVTGHKGFIGHHLVRHMKNTVGLDLLDNQDIRYSKLPKADFVIHLAAQTSVTDSVQDPLNDALQNIVGTIRLAKHYEKAKFIFASSGGAIQETIESPYGLSKFCAEEYIKLLHNNYVILRFPNIYGDGSNSVVDKFIKNKVNIYGDGTATRDYVSVWDLVEAIKLSLDWPVGTYHLGSGRSRTVMELAKATGKGVTFKSERKGELQHSQVDNDTPNWHPELDVLDYIKARV